MSRSIKKGPFADASLLKKIEAQEGSEKKQVIKTWSRRSTIFPSFVGFTMMEENMCQYTLLKIWLVIS